MTYAFVSLVSSDVYLPGALTQVAALRELHLDPPSPPELPFHTVCLVTPESVDVATIRRLRGAYDHVIGVEILEQDNAAGLKLLGRPDLTTVLTKLHVFRLIQYTKVIFLDADVLPIRPMSHLFALPHEFSAVPDVGWPDIFNSGVLVLAPGEDKFEQLHDLLLSKPSWDGGDQGILNEWRGDNWNRLSFTYNTTPTAAYTYAPAYERYGSQIKAIHFIGPHKPWNSIPYRMPNSRRQEDSSNSVQRAYDYLSLVDRWFDVYDRHYNAPAITPQTPFEVNRYVAAWDQPVKSAEPALAAALDLDELKRLALEGLSATTSDSRPGEGSYQSLPLQGRVDLMRPRKEPEVLTQSTTDKPRNDSDSGERERSESDYFNYGNHEDVLSTPVPRYAPLHKTETRWHTLPTPGPHEVPPSPRLKRISLPATPSNLPLFPTPTPDFYASESERESLLLFRGDSEHSQQHHESTTHGHHNCHPHHQSHHHEHTSESHEHQLSRPRSPPLLSWNPAIEPPPNTTPAPNAFPTDTYFANVWDLTPSRRNDQTNVNPSPSNSNASKIFQPPPAPVIPRPLVNQGHYRNVTGESTSGATPSPDKNQIKPVFPWEAGRRAMPTRIFPDSDAPPPSLFLSPDSQSQTSATSPSTPETRSTARSQTLSPLYGLPQKLTYSNAWDNIPSIQHYASKLVKPAIVIPPALAPPFEDDAYPKKKSWDDTGEMSSRDGDDEDNADDEDDEEPAASSSVKWDDDSDGESAKRRSRRGSIVTASALLRGSKKEYRNRGVQTAVVETRSMGVQVDTSQASARQDKPAKRASVTLKKHWIPAIGVGVVAPMTTTKDVYLGEPLTVNTTSLQQQRPVLKPRSKSDASSHSSTPRSPARSPREFIAPASRPGNKSVSPSVKPTLRSSGPSSITIGPNKGYVAPTAPEWRSASAIASTPTVTSPGDALTSVFQNESFNVERPLPLSVAPSSHKKTVDMKASPSSLARKPSNESSLGSPVSSIGPLSPPDGHALLSPLRKGTRVWDPARGVDLFKRGSEEVLARFLKMGSWEDEMTR